MNCQRWVVSTVESTSCFRILLLAFRFFDIVDISGPLLPLSIESPVIQDLVVCTRSTLSLTPYHASDHVMLIYNPW